MITVSDRVFKNRIDKLVEDLGYVSSATFLRGLSLKQHESSALAFLVFVFPKSKDDASHSLNEFGQHLWQGWRAESFYSGTSIGFRLFNELEANKRARIVLQSLDTGTQPYDFTPEDTLHFLGNLRTAKGNLGRKTNWITLTPNKTYHYHARPGVQYSSKATLFIESQIMPQIKEDISYKVMQRLKRI